MGRGRRFFWWAWPRRRCSRSLLRARSRGGLIGKFVDKRLETEMHDKIGENLPPGTAGIIAAFDDSERLAVEQALPGALAKSVVQTDKKGVQALKDGLAEAMGNSCPTGRCCRSRTRTSAARWVNDRPVGRRLDDHPRREGARGRANVLLILIDDAGLASPTRSGGRSPLPT